MAKGLRYDVCSVECDRGYMVTWIVVSGVVRAVFKGRKRFWREAGRWAKVEVFLNVAER